MKIQLCCLAQGNAPAGVYEHRGDHGLPQCSCQDTRTISAFSAFIMCIPTMVHLGQPQNILPKSWIGGDKTHCCWTYTFSRVAQLHEVVGKHLADPLHQHHTCAQLDCSTRNKCYSHPTKEGSWSMTKARAAGGRASGRPEWLRQGHGWCLSSLWREALLKRVTK